MSKEKGRPVKKKKKKGWVSTLFLFLILLLGAGIMAYPTFSDWWNSFHQSRAIASYATVVENTDAALMERLIDEAQAYNKRLLRKANRYEMDDEEREEYESLLDLTGTGIMGYIQITTIGVNLPIYHGVEENVLQVAIGHIEGTSLPVGGESTHAVVSGHRGLPSAKLFSDLDKLEEGDRFTITIMNRVLTYEVDQIRIVEPTDVSDLSIVSGEDYVTLVTCTPYGINTHRLLVRGHRIEVDDEHTVVVLPGAIRIPNYIVIPSVGIPLLFVFLLGLLIYYRRRKPEFTEDELLEQYNANREAAEERERKRLDSLAETAAEELEARSGKPAKKKAEKPAEPTPEPKAEKTPEPAPKPKAEKAPEQKPKPETKKAPEQKPKSAADDAVKKAVKPKHVKSPETKTVQPRDPEDPLEVFLASQGISMVEDDLDLEAIKAELGMDE